MRKELISTLLEINEGIFKAYDAFLTITKCKEDKTIIQDGRLVKNGIFLMYTATLDNGDTLFL